MPPQTTAPAGQDNQDKAASYWWGLDQQKRQELLGRMSPEQRKNLATRLGQRGTARAPAAPAAPAAPLAPNPAPASYEQFWLQSEKAPEGARFPSLGRTGYDIIDPLIGAAPGVGAATGTAAAAPFAPLTGPMGPVIGAGTGAMAGDRARRYLQQLMYKDLPPESAGQILWSMGSEGLSWAGQEGINQWTAPALAALERDRAIFNAAKKGEAIRYTLGESNEMPMFKLGENVLSHWPGGAGTFQKFRGRGGQLGDIQIQLEKRLREIAARNLPPEEAYTEVQEAVRDAKAQLDPGVGADLQRLETTHEVRSEGIIDQQRNALSPRQISKEELGTQLQTQLRDEQEQIQATTKRDVERIQQTQQQNLDTAFDPDLNALNPITGTTSEQAGAPIKANLQAQQEAAQAAATQNIETAASHLSPVSVSSEEIGAPIKGRLQEQQATAQANLKTNVAQVRATQDANINQIIDQEAHGLSPVQTSREQAGLVVQKTLTDLQQQLRQTINAKYDQVKALMGKQFATPAEMREFAETNPEARTLLDDANALYKQEQPRFDIPIIAKILKTPPEKIASVLANASLADLRFLKDYLPQNVQQVMTRELWEAIVYKATNPRTGVVNTTELANSLKALQDDRGESIFGANYGTIASSVGRIDRENAAADSQVEQLTTQANPNKLTKDILSRPPEQIADLMMTASLEDLRAFKGAIPQDMYNAAARDVFEKVASAKSPTDALEKLGDRGRAIFGDQYDSIAKTFRDASQANAPFDNPLMQNILNKPPEQVADLMMTASLEDLRTLKTMIPADMYNTAANQVLRRIIAAPPGKIVSEQSLAKAMTELDPERAKIIFGDRYNSIIASIERFNRINKEAEASAAQVEARTSKFDLDLYKQIVKKNQPAEEVTSLLAGASNQDLRQLMSDLSPEMQQDLRRNVLEGILERTGVRDPQTDAINEKRFATELQKLGEDRGRIIFGDQYDGLIQSSKRLDRLAQVAEAERAKIGKRTSPYDAGLLNEIIKTNDPLTIAATMSKAGPEELRTLMQQLPPETRQVAARNVMEHYIEPARPPETLLEKGEIRATPRGKFETGEVDPKLLSESLDKMLRELTPARAQAIFGDQYQKIVQLSAALKRIGFSESQMMGKMHMAGVITATLAAVTGGGGRLLTGEWGLGSELLAGVGGSLLASFGLAKMLSWMLTNPEVGDLFVGNALRVANAVALGVPVTLDVYRALNPPTPASKPPLVQLQYQPEKPQ